MSGGAFGIDPIGARGLAAKPKIILAPHGNPCHYRCNSLLRRRTLGYALAAVAAGLALWAAGAPYLAGLLVVERPLQHADAILVLAGSRAYVERGEKAAELYHRRVAPVILLTDDGGQAGWYPKEQRNPAFVDLARRNLLARGVPPEAIGIMPGHVSGTIEEARAAAQHAIAHGWKSLMLVTSAHHTRRALRTFERSFAAQGTAVRLGIAGAGGAGTDWRSWPDIAGEHLKAAYYALAY